jgi:hypothetical protein
MATKAPVINLPGAFSLAPRQLRGIYHSLSFVARIERASTNAFTRVSDAMARANPGPSVRQCPSRISSATRPQSGLRKWPTSQACQEDLRSSLCRRVQRKEEAMAQEPLATKGNYLHIYDFRVQKGHEEEFIRSFEKFDYSDGNPMHKSKAQVKDGVLCRDTEDPQRFFLIAEWADIDEHARIRKILANEIKPEFIKYIEGGKFIPKYVEVVSSTPDEILNKAAS